MNNNNNNEVPWCLTMIGNIRHHRRRTVLVLLLAGTAALSLQTLLNSPGGQLRGVGDDRSEGGDNVGEMSSLVTEEEQMEETAMMADAFHRILLGDDMDDDEDAEVLAIPGEEGAAEGKSGDAKESPTVAPAPPFTQLIDADKPLPPYDIRDAVDTSKMYDHTYALLVYDPEDDTFRGMFSRRHYWVTGVDKLNKTFTMLVYMLRKLFPERFQGKAGKSAELVIPISSGDYPGVRTACLDHFRQESTNPNTPPGWQEIMKSGSKCSFNAAPILHFGSVFRQPNMFPNTIAMPMPEPHHLYCAEEWLTYGRVCNQMSPARSKKKGMLVFGEEFGLQWDDLIPQVVWRGTDFSYLTKVHPALSKPKFEDKMINWPMQSLSRHKQFQENIGGMNTIIAQRKLRRTERLLQRNKKRGEHNLEMLENFHKAAAVKSLKVQYDMLLPRWKAVVLTAEAEVEARGPVRKLDALPWANMKFASYIANGGKTRTQGAEHYKDWEKIGFPATGGYMSHTELAKYKYHIDLGGGGGTTWSGTVEKLAMPGLLFHHMTPTKDYIHDWMKPWVHFIPVSSDLRDLKRKYEWAEAHPEQSKQIAEESTKLMRYLTSEEGYAELFRRDVEEPLRRVIEAYKPINEIHQETSWRNWKEALRQYEGDDTWLDVIKCTGYDKGGCEHQYARNWMRKFLTHRVKRHLYGGA